MFEDMELLCFGKGGSLEVCKDQNHQSLEVVECRLRLRVAWNMTFFDGSRVNSYAKCCYICVRSKTKVSEGGIQCVQNPQVAIVVLYCVLGWFMVVSNR